VEGGGGATESARSPGGANYEKKKKSPKNLVIWGSPYERPGTKKTVILGKGSLEPGESARRPEFPASPDE